MKLVVVTGVSGAGKSTAVHALEDLGYYCVDNLPMPLLPKFVELIAGRREIGQAGLVIDAREGEFLADVAEAFASIRRAGHAFEVLFLDAPDEVLIRRYSETRRRHPMSGTDIRTGIALERQRLERLRDEASVVIDTGDLTVHVLRGLVMERYGQAHGSLAVTLCSFGFKYGLPAEADMVLDVRFLPNPHFVEGLSALTGESETVAAFVLGNEEAQAFVSRAMELLVLSIRGFEREGKSYATIAIGCTGGRHRSVAMVEELRRRVQDLLPVSVRHRDVRRV